MGLRGEGNGLVKRKRSRAVPPPAAAAAAVYVQRVFVDSISALCGIAYLVVRA